MYDELIKRLRLQADVERFYSGEPMLNDQAADAIESVSKAYQMMAEAYEIEVTKQKWIPVTERLPEVNKYVLGCFKNGSMTAVCFFEIDENITFWRACTDEGWEADCDSEPTHWMPLPEPPKEE